MLKPGGLGLLLALLLSAGSLTYAAGDVTFDDVQAAINSGRTPTIPSVLASLPEDVRANFTVVYESHSLQEASYQSPRAIVFSKDGKLVLTFNGDSKQRGYQTIEIIQYRDQESAFEFRHIDFSGPKPVISEKNPEACQDCHGKNLRPIWSNYPNWPGVYGSGHDLFLKGAEFDEFAKWVDLWPNHDRYKYLVRKPFESENYPYLPAQSKAEEHRYRPNNRLGKFFARLNAKRIAKLITTSATWPMLTKKERAFLTAWLIGCPKVAWEAYLPDLLHQIESTYPERWYHWKSDYPLIDSPQDRVSYLMEKLLTGPTEESWNLAHGLQAKGVRSFSGDGSIEFHVATELLPQLIGQDPDFAKFYKKTPYSEFYDALVAPGCYVENVLPGGMGTLYDEMGEYFDVKLAQSACDELLK